MGLTYEKLMSCFKPKRGHFGHIKGHFEHKSGNFGPKNCRFWHINGHLEFKMATWVNFRGPWFPFFSKWPLMGPHFL